MILFDTDTLTHFSYGNANVRRKIEEVGDEPLAVAVIDLLPVFWSTRNGSPIN